MKRRDFLKTTMLFAAVSTVLGKASGVLNNALAAGGVFAAAGKLGYKDVSEFTVAKGKPVDKLCSGCKYYKANTAAGAGAGECTFAAMKAAMKPATEVYVKDAGYCNMWAKKA